jgi:hypothetical protein
MIIRFQKLFIALRGSLVYHFCKRTKIFLNYAIEHTRKGYRTQNIKLIRFNSFPFYLQPFSILENVPAFNRQRNTIWKKNRKHLLMSSCQGEKSETSFVLHCTSLVLHLYFNGTSLVLHCTSSVLQSYFGTSELQVKYGWSTVKYEWNTSEVRMKYEWSTVKYKWSTSEVRVKYEWSTGEVCTPEVSLFPFGPCI